MREALLILLVLLVLAALTAYRYRRGIRTVLEFWRMISAVRDKARHTEKQIPAEPAAAGPLVHCPRCGKWVAEEKAIRLGRSSFYCSTQCLEASVKTGAA
jgi:hypothetical protein